PRLPAGREGRRGVLHCPQEVVRLEPLQRQHDLRDAPTRRASSRRLSGAPREGPQSQVHVVGLDRASARDEPVGGTTMRTILAILVLSMAPLGCGPKQPTVDVPTMGFYESANKNFSEAVKVLQTPDPKTGAIKYDAAYTMP